MKVRRAVCPTHMPCLAETPPDEAVTVASSPVVETRRLRRIRL